MTRPNNQMGPRVAIIVAVIGACGLVIAAIIPFVWPSPPPPPPPPHPDRLIVHVNNLAAVDPTSTPPSRNVLLEFKIRYLATDGIDHWITTAGDTIADEDFDRIAYASPSNLMEFNRSFILELPGLDEKYRQAQEIDFQFRFLVQDTPNQAIVSVSFKPEDWEVGTKSINKTVQLGAWSGVLNMTRQVSAE